MSKQRKTIRHYVDRETLRRALQYYPVITSQDLREWADFSDPHHDVIIVPRDEWITRIAPHTSPKIKKALSAGRGLYTVHLAGGDLLRELFYHMTPQTRFIHGAPTVCCYDFKNVPPDLYNAEQARYPFRGFYYLTNIDVATFAQAYNVPEELKGDTRYLSFCNVSGNFQPDILAGILQTIRNVIQPESFFISISLLYGGKDHERREVRSIIRLILSRKKAEKLPSLDFAAFQQKGIFTLPLPPDSPIRNILPPGYPSTRLDAWALTQYLSPDYILTALDVRRDDPRSRAQFSHDSPYDPSAVLLFFSRRVKVRYRNI